MRGDIVTTLLFAFINNLVITVKAEGSKCMKRDALAVSPHFFGVKMTPGKSFQF